MEIYNTQHGNFVANDSDDWSGCIPYVRLQDAVFNHIECAGLSVGDGMEIGMCYQWEPDQLPTLEQLREAVPLEDWNSDWLEDITPKLEASFEEHMKKAALAWFDNNHRLPGWYWVRNTRSITVTKEMLIRFYREWCHYSDADLADLDFDAAITN